LTLYVFTAKEPSGVSSDNFVYDISVHVCIPGYAAAGCEGACPLGHMTSSVTIISLPDSHEMINGRVIHCRDRVTMRCARGVPTETHLVPCNMARGVDNY